MRRTSLPLVVIIAVAIILRFYQISSNPKAMYGDELTAVYDAYSIFKTGHDQKGNFLPLVFPLGGGRPAGYVYATVPFAAIFGPAPLAARMVSVLSGIGIVFLLYLLGKQFFSKEIGLSIAAVAAINPWQLSLSRGPFETHFALFLTLLGFYAFIQGFKKPAWFLIFGLSFGLASQTYSTYKLITPLFTILLLIWRRSKKFVFLLSAGIILASTILAVFLTVSRGKEDRFDIINIFKDPGLRSEISQKVKKDRLMDSLSPTTSYILHTPHLELAGVLIKNYIGNFYPDFLFVSGDGQPRHNPAGMGQFFWIDALLLIVGIIYLYKLNKKFLILLVGWILIAPIPSSLVGEAHALRSSFLLPPLLIFSGIGLWKLWSIRTKPLDAAIFTALIFLFLFQFILFLDSFYFVAPQKNSRFWSYPAKKAFLLAEKNKQKFDFVILSNDIDNMEFAYPTYSKLDPNLVIKQNRSPERIGEYKFFKYDNIYIGSLPNTRVKQFIKDLPGSVLYIGADKEEPFLENYKIMRDFSEQPELIISSKGNYPDLYLKD